VPDLFPETAAAVADVAGGGDRKRKVIAITWEHYVQPAARGEGRIYGPRSWKRADGEEARDDMGRKIKSKTCDKSGLGVIVAGPGRGDAFEVCVNRTCEVHFPQTAAKAKKKAGSAAAAAQREQDRWKAVQEKRKREDEKREARFARFKLARSPVLEAVAAAVKKANAGAGGPLAPLIVTAMEIHGSEVKRVLDKAGKTAEDLVRHLAYRELEHSADDDYWLEEFVSGAKKLGVDVEKLVDQYAPIEKPAKAKTAKKPRGRS
jgi:hypothetical protein